MKRKNDFDSDEVCKQAILFCRVSSKHQKYEGVSPGAASRVFSWEFK